MAYDWLSTYYRSQISFQSDPKNIVSHVVVIVCGVDVVIHINWSDIENTGAILVIVPSVNSCVHTAKQKFSRTGKNLTCQKS